MIQSFAEKTGAQFRFGVLIGGGTMIYGAKDAPFMKRILAELNAAFRTMQDDILNDAQKPVKNICISVSFPKKLYFFMGGRGWVSSARKNMLKKKDLYRKPYRE